MGIPDLNCRPAALHEHSKMQTEFDWCFRSHDWRPQQVRVDGWLFMYSRIRRYDKWTRRNVAILSLSTKNWIRRVLNDAIRCFYLAPCSCSNFTISSCPPSDATCNAVLPSSPFTSALAPCSSSRRTASGAPLSEARCKGV